MFVPWAEFRYAAGMTKEQPGTGARRSPRSGGCPNETRQKLITAATGVFAEHGFRGASVREIADAVGNDIDIICDGGIRRGTHVIKALAAGAKACSGGRMYLYALAAAGQPGVEKALGNMRSEIERDMKLMGVTKIDQLNRDMLRYR